MWGVGFIVLGLIIKYSIIEKFGGRVEIPNTSDNSKRQTNTFLFMLFCMTSWENPTQLKLCV